MKNRNAKVAYYSILDTAMHTYYYNFAYLKCIKFQFEAYGKGQALKSKVRGSLQRTDEAAYQDLRRQEKMAH